METIQITPTVMGIDHLTLRGKRLWVVHREVGVSADEFILTDTQVQDFMKLYENSATVPNDFVDWFMNEVNLGKLELL